MIAASHSGAGKTTVTAAVLHALVRRGMKVQPFKIGPDFIDPMYHEEIAHRPSINLDVWLMGEEGVRRTFHTWSSDADIAVIEAMGALYDGADGGDQGSAAHISRILGVPVIVVLDVYGMTRTTDAIMRGMLEFDPSIDLAGWVLNRVGSRTHADLIVNALPDQRRESIVGLVQSRAELEIGERHLGLVTVAENTTAAPARRVALDHAAADVDIDRLILIAQRARPVTPSTAGVSLHRVSGSGRARLAIARDEAFCFYYQENLRLLDLAGFDLIPFSPVHGDPLPEADAIYFGGGYPESFADQLAQNRRLAGQLQNAADAGTPIYAECGGLMYLGRSLVGFDGRTHTMAGVIPIDTAMDSTYLAIRYVEARTRHDSFFGPAGTLLRGQEFHQSRVVASDIEHNLYDVTTSSGETFPHGYLYRSVIASYLHLHFLTTPSALRHLATTASRASLLP